jgi:competence protein ComEC
MSLLVHGIAIPFFMVDLTSLPLTVGILAGLVWLVCRLLSLSPRKSTLLAMAAVLGLAVVSGGRPPIVRATVFLGIASMGLLASRQSHANNILAIAAMVILAWNPSDLFDVGTQLSFLAVMGMLMSAGWRAPRADRTQLAIDESQLDSRLRQALAWMANFLGSYLSLMLGIWLLTGPLIAARFHLISPIGMLLNIFLIPLVVAVLWSGYLLLLVGWLVPMAAFLFAVPLEAGLTFLLGVVQWGAGVHLGHLYVAGPPNWWLGGYYLLLAGLYVFRLRIDRPRFTGGLLLLCWTAIGLGIAAWPMSPRGLRATFLSVGHSTPMHWRNASSASSPTS